jgi:hypothetical protein
MKNENLLLHYALEREFNNDPLNEIGATDSTTLRNVTTHNNSNTKYVRKFGKDYAINDITNIVIDTPRSDGGGTNKWWYEFYNENDTLLGTVKDENGVSTFVDGTAETSTRVYIKIVRKSGTVSITDGDSISLTTNIDSPLTVFLPGESMASPVNELLLALAESGSTYYMENTSDNSMIYGGYRHIETGTQKYPYFKIQDAIDDVVVSGGSFTIVTVLNGGIFDEELDTDYDGLIVQTEEGTTAIITRGIGARTTRNTTLEFNNANAIYFNTNGSDSNPGTWQQPVLTLSQVDTLQGAGSKHAIYGGINTTDSAIYNELIDFNALFLIRLEPDYFYSLTLRNKVSNIELYGIELDGSSHSTDLVVLNGTTRNVKDCSFLNSSINAINFDGQNFGVTSLFVQNCFFNNNVTQISASNLRLGLLNVTRNILLNHQIGIFSFESFGVLHSSSMTIFYNLFDSINQSHNKDISIEISGSGKKQWTGSIKNNTFINGNNTGIYFENQAFLDFSAVDFDNNIFTDKNKAVDNDNITYTAIFENNCFYNNTIDTEGLVTNTNPINQDPLLIDKKNGFFGIKPKSPCYRAGNDNDDVGIKTRIIEINESNIEINGFNIDGQNAYTNGLFIADSVNHTGLNLKWNTFTDFIGSIVDLYDDDTDLDSNILNCIFKNSGYGVGLRTGGNLIQECLIYKNKEQGIYFNGLNDTINHNVIFGNNDGLYFDTGSNPLIIKNNIITENAIGIFSEIVITSTIIKYNDISFNSVSAIVNITDSTNINANPLFINTIDIGSEDFNIKTKETNILDSDGNIIGQYTIDSPCKNAADDGFDMGAYKVDREKTKDWFSHFQLYNNPFELNPDTTLKGGIDFENSEGSPFKLGKSHKWVFPFIWDENDDQTEDQVDILRYISTLSETEENGLTGDQVNILLHILPEQFLLTGINGTIDSIEKTISDSSLDLKPNKFKGFHIGIKFLEGTNLVIDGIAKTGTKSGESWETDEFKNYFYYHNFNYYLITGNTSEVLSFSDPYDTLESETVSNFAIEKYFKILGNSKNQFLIQDPDNELINGDYDYYIDFIICKVLNDNFQPIQEGFYYQRQKSKTGYEFILGQK